MKKFWEFSKMPLIVGAFAALLLIADSLISQIYGLGTGFLWVAFISWTVFSNSTLRERIIAVPSYIIGFLAAIAMMEIGNLFTLNVYVISIASVFAIFIINVIIMYFANLKKFISIPAIFVGITLVFSGLGIGLSPISNFEDSLIMLSIILVYGILGLACAFFTTFFTNKIKNK